MRESLQCPKCKANVKDSNQVRGHKCKKKDLDAANKAFVEKIQGISFGKVPGGTR